MILGSGATEKDRNLLKRRHLHGFQIYARVLDQVEIIISFTLNFTLNTHINYIGLKFGKQIQLHFRSCLPINAFDSKKSYYVFLLSYFSLTKTSSFEISKCKS